MAALEQQLSSLVLQKRNGSSAQQPSAKRMWDGRGALAAAYKATELGALFALHGSDLEGAGMLAPRPPYE